MSGQQCRHATAESRLVRMNNSCASFSKTFASTVVVLAFFLQFGCGGRQNPDDWVPADKDLLRKLVSNVSEFRGDPEKFGQLFTGDAVPDEKWLADVEGLSFEINEIKVSGDEADVVIDVENHFGEVQHQATWKCQQADERWVIASSPIK